MLPEGIADGEILKASPDLEQKDLRKAWHFAAEAVRECELRFVNRH
jgi:uncharacterized protein (DUF433 family)